MSLSIFLPHTNWLVLMADNLQQNIKIPTWFKLTNKQTDAPA